MNMLRRLFTRRPAVTPQPNIGRIAGQLVQVARKSDLQFDDVVDVVRCVTGTGPDVRISGNRTHLSNYAGSALASVSDVEALLDEVAHRF